MYMININPKTRNLILVMIKQENNIYFHIFKNLQCLRNLVKRNQFHFFFNHIYHIIYSVRPIFKINLI